MTAVAHTPGARRSPAALPGRGPRPDPLHDRARHHLGRRLRHRRVPPPDGSYGVNAVMSDACASFHLIPGGEDAPNATTIRPAPQRGPGHVIRGVDHTKPTE